MTADPMPEMDPYDIPLNEMVTYRLSRLNAQLSAQATKFLKKSSGLTLTQWRVLVILDTNGETLPSEIVRKIDLDKGQLSRTIKGMVSGGLIDSRISESDGRSHVLSMTNRGRELFETARPAMRERQLCLLESLNSEERSHLFSALEKISAAAARLDNQE